MVRASCGLVIPGCCRQDCSDAHRDLINTPFFYLSDPGESADGEKIKKKRKKKKKDKKKALAVPGEGEA